MTQREKTLATIVGALLVVISVGFVGWRIYSAFAIRESRKNDALAKLTDSVNTIEIGAQTGQILQGYADRALPPDSDVARSMYQDWLSKLVVDLKLRNARVTTQSTQTRGDVYTVLPFHVIGDGNIEQLTDLLYAIYTNDAVQRVKSLTINPQKDKKDMKITLVVEVLSMPTAPSDRKQVAHDPKGLVAGKDREYYRSKIIGRNVFGPENKPPSLRGDANLVAYRGQPFEFTAQAEDPDKDDVTFDADLSKLPGARLRVDRLEWTPQSNGEYTMTLVARDNGFPARETTREFKISVKDPPPRSEPRPSFDAAKHAYITGVTESNGKPQVWVTVRTEGRTVRLGIGDTFRIGQLEGKIAAVDGNNVVIDAGGQQITTKLGQPIVQ